MHQWHRDRATERYDVGYVPGAHILSSATAAYNSPRYRCRGEAVVSLTRVILLGAVCAFVSACESRTYFKPVASAGTTFTSCRGARIYFSPAKYNWVHVYVDAYPRDDQMRVTLLINVLRPGTWHGLTYSNQRAPFAPIEVIPEPGPVVVTWAEGNKASFPNPLARSGNKLLLTDSGWNDIGSFSVSGFAGDWLEVVFPPVSFDDSVLTFPPIKFSKTTELSLGCVA